MDKDIIISGIHLELTDALKQIVLKKAEKLFRHETGIIRIHVELMQTPSKDPTDKFTAKGLVEIQGPNIVASAISDDLYKSIDQLIQKLDHQISKHNRK